MAEMEPLVGTPMLDASRARQDERRAISDELRQRRTLRTMQRKFRSAVRNNDFRAAGNISQLLEGTALGQKIGGTSLAMEGGGIEDSISNRNAAAHQVALDTSIRNRMMGGTPDNNGVGDAQASAIEQQADEIRKPVTPQPNERLDLFKDMHGRMNQNGLFPEENDYQTFRDRGTKLGITDDQWENGINKLIERRKTHPDEKPPRAILVEEPTPKPSALVEEARKIVGIHKGMIQDISTARKGIKESLDETQPVMDWYEENSELATSLSDEARSMKENRLSRPVSVSIDPPSKIQPIKPNIYSAIDADVNDAIKPTADAVKSIAKQIGVSYKEANDAFRQFGETIESEVDLLAFKTHLKFKDFKNKTVQGATSTASKAAGAIGMDRVSNILSNSSKEQAVENMKEAERSTQQALRMRDQLDGLLPPPL